MSVTSALKILFWSLLTFCLFAILLEWRLRTSAPLKPYIREEVETSSLRVLVLGDSITKGDDHTKASYPNELEKILNKLPLKKKIQVINEGVSGAELLDLYRGINGYLDEYRPHVVLTMIGYRNNYTTAYEWIRNLRSYRLYFIFDTWLKGMIDSPNQWQDEKSFFDFVMSTGFDSIEYHRFFGARLRREKRYEEALNYHKKVIEKYPLHEMAYLELGQVYSELADLEMAEHYFDTAIALNYDTPQGSWANALKFFLYKNLKQTAKAEQHLKSVIKKYSNSPTKYIFIYCELLYTLYEHERELDKFTAFIEDVLQGKEIDPKIRLLLGRAYDQTGESKKAEYQYRMANRVEQQVASTNSGQSQLYRQLSRAIQERGILHVAVQYPRQPIQQLYSWLGKESQLLMLIDNQENFENALKSNTYEQIFVDRFSGDFGHLTLKGSHLVAEAIASRLEAWLIGNGYFNCRKDSNCF
ncbi:MAG: hypothetical protein M9962_10860 [Oligoflexia bacterium]|nr:hypothetical protein [Oligoflexia bacterium]